MSEDEKEAIECLELVLDNETDIETEDLTNKCINNILNLIKKQQDKIEDLKKEKRILIEKYTEVVYECGKRNEIKEIPISDDYISKDKIKEKIKEYNSLLYSIEERDKLGDRADKGSVNSLMAQIAILNSLLGE